MDWRARKPIEQRRGKVQTPPKEDWGLGLLWRQMVLCGLVLGSIWVLGMVRPQWMPQARKIYHSLQQNTVISGAVYADLWAWALGALDGLEMPTELKMRVRALAEQYKPDPLQERDTKTSALEQTTEPPSVADNPLPAESAGTLNTAHIALDIDGKAADITDTGGAGGLLFWGESAVPASCTLEPLGLILPLEKPLQNGKITSVFGWRNHPISGKPDFHRGVDYAAPLGTPIYAAKAGVVQEVGWSDIYGNFVTLAHAGGLLTTYAHCDKVLVQEMTWVVAGTVIGRVGSTGVSSGAHLHFEAWRDGIYYDPLTGLR